MAANASELYREMLDAIGRHNHFREAQSPVAPQRMFEAAPGKSFTLRNPAFNLIDCRPVDMKHATALALHFFTGSEQAAGLRKYCNNADRFLVGDVWQGAYGAIAMPQIAECIWTLRAQPFTRRAIVSMGGPMPSDANRPACWTSLQFLNCRDGLNLVCFQRSLNVYGVMPYDLVILTSVLYYVAEAVDLPVGSFVWCVGSLHTPKVPGTPDGYRNNSLIVPAKDAAKILADPSFAPQPLRGYLEGSAV